MNYVLGFHFSTDGQRLTLLLKDRGHLAGLWNGIGGKCEQAEAPLQAMYREGKEEAGLATVVWDEMGQLLCHKSSESGVCDRINLFKTRSDEAPQQRESELVRVWGLESLPLNLVPNMRWLIPMMADESLFQITARTM